MSIIDILVVILILICGVVGFKRGVFKQAVVTIGTVLVFVLSYHFKDYLANFFSYNLPFFNFTGEFAGLSSINIIMYQMIAFLIMFAFFGTILAVLIKITGIFEKILKFTIVLGIPSKILGLLLGLVEGYIVAFVFLFVHLSVKTKSSYTYETYLCLPVGDCVPGLSGGEGYRRSAVASPHLRIGHRQ